MEQAIKLKILSIKGLTESKFGETAIIKANPIKDIAGMATFKPYEYDETIAYIVPESIVNEFVEIAQSNKLWEPNEYDFIKQTILNNGSRMKIFRHVGCYGNNPFLKYYVNQVSFNNQDFLDFDEEHWTFEKYGIFTPYGNLTFESLIFINEGPMVGIQFSTHGSIRFNEIRVPHNNSSVTSIKTIAIMRQPNNAWLWLYMYDANNSTVAVFCGYDDIDGLSRYVSKLKRSLAS